MAHSNHLHETPELFGPISIGTMPSIISTGTTYPCGHVYYSKFGHSLTKPISMIDLVINNPSIDIITTSNCTMNTVASNSNNDGGNSSTTGSGGGGSGSIVPITTAIITKEKRDF